MKVKQQRPRSSNPIKVASSIYGSTRVAKSPSVEKQIMAKRIKKYEQEKLDAEFSMKIDNYFDFN